MDRIELEDSVWQHTLRRVRINGRIMLVFTQKEVTLEFATREPMKRGPRGCRVCLFRSLHKSSNFLSAEGSNRNVWSSHCTTPTLALEQGRITFGPEACYVQAAVGPQCEQRQQVDETSHRVLNTDAVRTGGYLQIRRVGNLLF